MKTGFAHLMGALAVLLASPVLANSAAADIDPGLQGSAAELPPYLQCVPYAREVSGIQIYGDAHTWWNQAEGRFARGSTPRVGAVMAFKPHRNMRLGHVAAVSRIIDSRTILLRHSNWSPINGRRGQIEDDVRAIDVSPDNDWSQVRVWYDPIQALGKTPWPIHGFIYNGRGKMAQPARRKVNREPHRAFVAPKPEVRPETAVRQKSSRAFADAFGDLATPVKKKQSISQAPKRAPSVTRVQRQQTAKHGNSGPVDLIGELVRQNS